MFKVELLEKAKMKNIIVYLGTGSGKTFIAVILIKHLGDEVAQKKKVIFLANNVALLEQQAEVISKMTGLKTGSYCGAHGVDDWGRERWEKEWNDHQVLVFIQHPGEGIHQDVQLALIIIDECHHAVKVCSISVLSSLSVTLHCIVFRVTPTPRSAKKQGLEIPEILGLSASIVVKSVKREEFQQEKARLERVLDAKVETCDGISMETFVNFASESVTLYPCRQTDSQGITQFVSSQVYQAKVELLKIKSAEILALKTKLQNENNRSKATENLHKDHKFFSNFILGSTEALLSLGLYSLVAMEKSLLKELSSKCSRTSSHQTKL